MITSTRHEKHVPKKKKNECISRRYYYILFWWRRYKKWKQEITIKINCVALGLVGNKTRSEAERGRRENPHPPTKHTHRHMQKSKWIPVHVYKDYDGATYTFVTREIGLFLLFICSLFIDMDNYIRIKS